MRIQNQAYLYLNQSNWTYGTIKVISPLLEDIVWDQEYVVSFELEKQIDMGTGQTISTPGGRLEVYLSLPASSPQESILVATIDDNSTDSDIGTNWGKFEYAVEFETGVTTPSTGIAGVIGNSVVFRAVGSGENDFWRGRLDNVKVEKTVNNLEQAKCEIRINSIVGTPPPTDQGEAEKKYLLDLFDQEEKLFEFKFPRFAYRYKYIDGEYSSFSPFSSAAFIPGQFDYHPKKGYNLGMTNTLKSITLRGFLETIPADVTSVDILYKEEDSPNIYIVDTIKDFTKLEYKITSETLKNGISQSNQLLRHWDNVPRKALAQEVIGSRIVYGNYVQNYDLIDSFYSGQNYKVDLFPEVLSKVLTAGAKGVASIKSLRDYQVGIVYADKYGRQTPILTNENATLTVGKNKAENRNELRISIGNEGHPVNMEYFKFYIKDNTNEYYNLAMDRYYDAEDGNIWIAFPSSDRNKIDIDDFLILKKGVGSDRLIKEAARYKVIDIKNEAPDNIKRNEFLIGTKRHSNTNVNHNVFASSDLPFENDDSFNVVYDRVKDSSFANLHEDFNSRPTDKYYITISNNAIKKVTKRYELVALNIDDALTTWHLTIKEPFTSEINEFTDDVTGNNPTIILNDSYLNIYKSSIDNSPKFDGRFFVKIFNDDIFRRNVVEPINTERELEYKAIADGSRRIYGLETEGISDRILKHFDPTNGKPTVFDGAWADNTLAPGTLSNRVVAKDKRPLVSWRSYLEATNNIGEHVGTLNSAGSFGNNVADPDINNVFNFTGSRWMHYDAYFRAFNVDPDGIAQRKEVIDIHGADQSNQAFEDVWFFDKGRTSGQFENSNNSPHSGWDSLPNPGNGTTIGIKNANEGAFMEIGFGGIQPNNWPTITQTSAVRQDNAIVSQYLHHSDPTFYDLENGNLNYSSTQGNFIKNLSVGSQFRFKEDPMGEIYTIMDVSVIFRLRYEDIQTGLPTDQVNNPNDDFGTTVGVGTHVFPNSCYPLQVISKMGKNVYAPVSVQQYMADNFFTINSTIERDANSEPGVYKTSSFLRASNFTKNYRLWLDKELTWNPWEDTASALTNGQTITVGLADTTHGVNYVDVTSLTGTVGFGPTGPSADPKVFEDVRQIEKGMVLDIAPDGDSINAVVNEGANGLLMLPMVSVIKEGVGAGTHRVFFKNYNGGVDLTDTGKNGTLAVTTSGATLTFKQYPVNGLSPNSAKNLNQFRNTKGNHNAMTAGAIGTDALGYTIEFLEEITVRPDENVLPENPAVWETEPKKLETDLDIYHAISDFHSININNIEDFIPVGSLIEHENSFSIPPGTTIDSINAAGEITLSREIIVDPSTATISSWGWTDVSE